MAEKSKPLFLQYYKKNKKRLTKMDLIVHDLHVRISEKIDCLSCANCCKTLGPALYDKDIERMAKALRMKPAEVMDAYLKIDEDGDYVFKTMPCPFLMPDNYCSIYEHRPKACREYPHTDRKKFEQIYKLTVKNTATCPIAYEVLSELIEK
ncbi:Fe-S-cluster containining protein [Dysgonomonas sp. PFB1-18]|uniref:YkgJ family cysteine cluster protein n=1 Tax=unclassified Dysgonomonas TaxID=2630389 RepID=UPI0024749853|nr:MULTISPECIES: YkgJ family cysteine cluster protein [unclassified Dysgonomonas]MDH6310828.1 Fe-S-cluster containining protein [Dysgonomonas sp. PF1-14]MDH6340734.1 Fe-S-cluster containining protein [Dysgonomonas sp. PF1-16]MDH6382298.1 Fe-S-cluster containining protein [Dysgonomonas sp. PFB1-18]MDH6399648.1 Fe-S-cluster containining protein [Dysgonomonas sp. PF1-23]